MAIKATSRLKRFWGTFWLPYVYFFSSSPRNLTFTYLSRVLMSFRTVIDFYYFLSWIYAFIYFVRSYGGFQWAECLFSTSAGFSFSEVHVVALDFPGNGPRHVLRGIFSVCCSVSFSLLRLKYFGRSEI